MDNQMNSFPTGDAPKESKGAMIGTIISVILLILGGLFVLSNRRAATPTTEVPAEGDTININNQVSPAPTSSTDDSAKLEAEMDAEMRAMEAEMATMEAEVGRF